MIFKKWLPEDQNLENSGGILRANDFHANVIDAIGCLIAVIILQIPFDFSGVLNLACTEHPMRFPESQGINRVFHSGGTRQKSIDFDGLAG